MKKTTHFEENQLERLISGQRDKITFQGKTIRVICVGVGEYHVYVENEKGHITTTFNSKHYSHDTELVEDIREVLGLPIRRKQEYVFF